MLINDFVMQGGVRNYLGETQEVTAPKFWQSSEKSPPTELAYITEAEKGLLLDANLHGSLVNNKPNIGASGLLSFDGWGSRDPGQNVAGADISSDMDKDPDHSGWSDGRGSTAVADQTMSVEKEQRVEAKNVVDLVNSGVNLNDALTGKTSLERILDSKSPLVSLNVLNEIISPFANAANKKRRTSWLEGTDKYDMPLSRDFYIQHKRPFDPNATLVKGTPEHDFLVETGYFAQFENNNNNDDGGGDNNVILFDNPEDAKTIQTNEISMVNDYFSNLNNNNLGINADFLSTYNTAKTNMAGILDLTPNTQQYGYENTFASNYPRAMNSGNVFYAYLNEQGLI